MHADAPVPARSNERSSGPSSSQPASGDRLRHDPGFGGGGRELRRRGLVGARLDARGPQHVPLEQPGLVGDDGVLGEERQQRRIPDGGHREGLRDVVETLELLGPQLVAAGLRGLDPGALIAQQQGDDLELRARRGRDPAAAQGGLDLLDRTGDHRHDVVGDAAASSVPWGATASPRLGLASSSQELPPPETAARPPWQQGCGQAMGVAEPDSLHRAVWSPINGVEAPVAEAGRGDEQRPAAVVSM